MADILGRLLPRRRALLITSPAVLLSAALALVLVGAAFFTYLQVGGGGVGGQRPLAGPRGPAAAGCCGPPGSLRAGLRPACASRSAARSPVAHRTRPLSPSTPHTPTPPTPLPQVPSSLLYDPVALAIIALLWLAGGYIK
jgi:hypothetical protein